MGILPDSGRAAQRLDREVIGWLTTITARGRPQSSAVWFVVVDDAIYVQSRPEAAKLANIRANGKVSFHLDSDGAGGDIVTIDADAEVLDAPPPGLVDAYSEKYERVIRERIRSTPEAMLADYSATVRVIPRRARAW
ncbi:MAG TPA: pyridoxamine 5'-phosphate oxidase family protein [Acidimicrobiia bacterium]|jgi:PPOX class probable F420-dependent enzyme|nr:pyridoxamine 5'-phosphate oxidase family protein [Acidimicrobiia bacterium]